MNQVSAARPHTDAHSDIQASGSEPVCREKCVCKKFKIQAWSFSEGWYLRWFSLPFRVCQTVDCDLSICLSSLWHTATGSTKRAQISLLSWHYCQQHSMILEAFAGWLKYFLQQRKSRKDLIFWCVCVCGGKSLQHQKQKEGRGGGHCQFNLQLLQPVTESPETLAC